MPLLPLDPDQPTYGYRPAHAAPPAVSVITPYYNTGALFLETAQSLLRQSLQNWEWIIVNDGSTDQAALRALLPFRSADARIRVIDQPNCGLPAARNAGAALAQAPLLFFLDSDDLLAPTALEKLAWSLVAQPASAFATTWNITFGHKHFLWPRGFESRRAFLYENMATSQAMLRREVFEQVGGFDEARRQGLEDYEFWLRCAAHSLWGHDLHEYLIAIRSKAPHEYQSYRWAARDGAGAGAAFRRELRARYPALYCAGLPQLTHGTGGLLNTYTPVDTALPFANPLERPVGQRRILLLMPWLQIGGADRFALDLAASLTGRGDRVTLCLLRDEPHTWMTEMQQITPDVFNLAAFLAPNDYPRFLHYLIESRAITTVLVSNSQLAYQLLPYLRAHCPLVPFVDYLHMEEEHWRSGGLPRTALDHGDLLDMHVVSSQHLARWMRARGAPAEQVRVCTTNIDPVHWAPSATRRAEQRTALAIGDDTPVILFPARLLAQKRPRLMAEIVRQLQAHHTTFVCLVAGDGPDRRWLERFIRQHGLEMHLRLLGAVAPGNMRNLISAADMLLLPSEQEGIALSLFEAMAMEVVPVAADVGGQRELVTPACGCLIAHGTNEVEQYVAALALLIDDPAQRRRMARAGRQRIIAGFSQQAMTDCMQALFDEATERSQHAPQPPVSQGQGRAAALLAVEHYLLETRLRQFAPIKFALRLRQSPIRNALPLLGHVRAATERFDRALYAARRTTIQQLRQFTRRGA